MTPPHTTSPPPDRPTTPRRTLEFILNKLITSLLVTSRSVILFPGKWSLLRTKLSQLHSALHDLSHHPDWHSHPLFPDLLPYIHSTLDSLRSLTARCLDPTLPGGKLLLHSDLDIASTSISLHINDLNLLLRSGLLVHATNPSAIVLPHPSPTSSKDDLSLFIRDLFARLLIGSLDLKKKALDSLLRLLSDDPKVAAVVVHDGDVPCLLHLLDPSNHSLIRELAAAALSFLASASEASRRALFDEGALGPLLRLLDSGSETAREKAASAIEAITADPGNVWAMPAYGGISILVNACRPGGWGMAATQAKASRALRNVAAAVGDVMVEEGAIAVLVAMLGCGTRTMEEARRNAVHCLWILASGGEEMRARILREGALPRLIALFREPVLADHELMEEVLRALHALSASQVSAKALSGSVGFFARLSELISHGSAVMQQISAALLCKLFPGEEAKKAMAGSLPALVKMMELPKPEGVQAMAATALVLLLTVRSNRKDLSKDEKSMRRLVQLLDLKDGEVVSKRFPVSVLSALASGGGGSLTRIEAAGACQQLRKLGELDVPGAKKALQRITGGRLKSLFSSISWRE